MRTLITLLLTLALSVPSLAQTSKPPVDQALASQAVRSVALLYSQNAGGSLRMHCTATAYDKEDGGYKFVTAAHCVGEDDRTHQKVADTEDIPFYITFDERGDKTFYPAQVKGVGYQSRGDDFVILHVKTKQEWHTVPLGDEGQVDVEKPETTAILNVASPLGLGKQVFRGYISSVYLDRPVVQGDINWKGAMLLSIQSGPGSSGSALISEHQKAIVGFLVGGIDNNVVGIPVSKFKKFEQEVKDRKYKWERNYKPEPE